MTLRKLLITSCLLLTATWAQTNPATSPTAQPDTATLNKQNANNLCRIYFLTPKPGGQAAFEAGRKKHVAFHKAQNDTWTWSAYEIQTGDDTGNFVFATCGHAWADFDAWDAKMGKADTADANVNIAPFVQRATDGFYLYRADMSLAPPGQPPAPITAVTIYTLHPGAGPAFTAAIRRINEALSKQPDWPKTSGWLQLMNGGESPTFVLLNSRKSWADFAPLSKSVADVLTETYGKEESDKILGTLGSSAAHIYTHAATYRPDLSYVPAK